MLGDTSQFYVVKVKWKVGPLALAVGLLVAFGLWKKYANQPLYAPPVPDPGPLPAWVSETGSAEGDAKKWTFKINFIDVRHHEETSDVVSNVYARALSPREVWNLTYERGSVRLYEAKSVEVREGQVEVLEAGKWIPVPTKSGTEPVFIGQRIFLRASSVEGGSGVKLDVLGEISKIGNFWIDQSGKYTKLNPEVRRVYGTVVLPKKHVALFGGSVQKYAEEKDSSVPVFGGLPFIGPMFEYRRDLLVSWELMVTAKEGR